MRLNVISRQQNKGRLHQAKCLRDSRNPEQGGINKEAELPSNKANMQVKLI